MTMHDVAARALGLIDLTDLGDAATEDGARDLCRRAVTPHGAVAAVCLWPRFVATAKAALAGTGVKIATVVNFPAGGRGHSGGRGRDGKRAIADGADEIDLVMPYRAFLVGRAGFAETQIVRIRRLCDGTSPAQGDPRDRRDRRPREDPRRRRSGADGGGPTSSRPRPAKWRSTPPPEATTILLEAVAACGRAGRGQGRRRHPHRGRGRRPSRSRRSDHGRGLGEALRPSASARPASSAMSSPCSTAAPPPRPPAIEERANAAAGNHPQEARRRTGVGRRDRLSGLRPHRRFGERGPDRRLRHGGVLPRHGASRTGGFDQGDARLRHGARLGSARGRCSTSTPPVGSATTCP